ncbi:hypothetical protein BTA31_02550 [Bacillus haynesii]|uniref:Transposase n=1 Tax=Bacillus haynesii TaxID=1925021 RepID=A0ABX3I7E6_9BACI|nr:hypothetical protein BTA31_02550 [Bacillus haynesii]
MNAHKSSLTDQQRLVVASELQHKKKSKRIVFLLWRFLRLMIFMMMRVFRFNQEIVIDFLKNSPYNMNC